MVRQVAPIVQAMILLVFTMALPFLMAMGSFSLSTLMSLTLVQFSIIFWSFLFSLATWLDNFLLSGLLSSATGTSLVTGIMDSLSPVGTGIGTHVMAITWVTYSLYMLAPLVFTYFLGMVGVKAGDAISSGINNTTKSVGGAGNSGASKIFNKIKK